jgi:hypothetical protein
MSSKRSRSASRIGGRSAPRPCEEYVFARLMEERLGIEELIHPAAEELVFGDVVDAQ